MTDHFEPFWKKKSLEQMSKSEWEALCDGCGKCCLNKLEDDDTGEIAFTNLSCHLLDPKTCQCSDYKRRKAKVSQCQILTPKKVKNLGWLPKTCAYKLVAEGKDLPAWHHLVSGSRKTIHNKGMSVKGKIINENQVHEDHWEDHVVTWIE